MWPHWCSHPGAYIPCIPSPLSEMSEDEGLPDLLEKRSALGALGVTPEMDFLFNPFTPRDCFGNTKYPDATRLPVFAHGGILHTSRKTGENTPLCTEEVPLQPDTKITNSENRVT